MEDVQLVNVAKGVDKFINDTQIIDNVNVPRDTENEWNDYLFKLTCMQGWFLRCSWFTKITFFKKLTQFISNLNIIVQILYTLYSALGKDRVYVETQGLYFFQPDKIIIDNNRCLEKIALEKVFQNTFNWFEHLNDCKQYLTITGLIKLGDYSVAGKVFKEYYLILKKRLPPRIVDPPAVKEPKSKKNKKEKKEKKPKKEKGKRKGKKEKKDKIKIEKIVIEKTDYEKFVENIDTPIVLDKATEMLKTKWMSFIKSYKKQLGIKEPEQPGKPAKKEKKKKAKKEKISKDLPDQIQLLPIWINKSIVAKIEAKKLAKLKKVNKYWGYIIKELKKDGKCRQTINKNKIKLQKKICGRKYIPILNDTIYIKHRKENRNFQKILQAIDLESHALFSDCLQQIHEDVPVTVFPRYVNLNLN